MSVWQVMHFKNCKLEANKVKLGTKRRIHLGSDISTMPRFSNNISPVGMFLSLPIFMFWSRIVRGKLSFHFICPNTYRGYVHTMFLVTLSTLDKCLSIMGAVFTLWASFIKTETMERRHFSSRLHTIYIFHPPETDDEGRSRGGRGEKKEEGRGKRRGLNHTLTQSSEQQGVARCNHTFGKAAKHPTGDCCFCLFPCRSRD